MVKRSSYYPSNENQVPPLPDRTKAMLVTAIEHVQANLNTAESIAQVHIAAIRPTFAAFEAHLSPTDIPRKKPMEYLNIFSEALQQTTRHGRQEILEDLQKILNSPTERIIKETLAHIRHRLEKLQTQQAEILEYMTNMIADMTISLQHYQRQEQSLKANFYDQKPLMTEAALHEMLESCRAKMETGIEAKFAQITQTIRQQNRQILSTKPPISTPPQLNEKSYDTKKMGEDYAPLNLSIPIANLSTTNPYMWKEPSPPQPKTEELEEVFPSFLQQTPSAQSQPDTVHTHHSQPPSANSNKPVWLFTGILISALMVATLWYLSTSTYLTEQSPLALTASSTLFTPPQFPLPTNPPRNLDPQAEKAFAIGLSHWRDAQAQDAFAAMQKAANLNHPEGQYYLAKFYENGDGTAIDETLAQFWLGKAAFRGYSRAQHDYATYFAQGRGNLAVNMNSARSWFTQAALAGLTDSQFNLAVLLESAHGEAQDLAAAYFWYKVAATQGDTGAQERHMVVAEKLPIKQVQTLNRQAESFAAHFKS